MTVLVQRDCKVPATPSGRSAKCWVRHEVAVFWPFHVLAQQGLTTLTLHQLFAKSLCCTPTYKTRCRRQATLQPVNALGDWVVVSSSGQHRQSEHVLTQSSSGERGRSSTMADSEIVQVEPSLLKEVRDACMLQPG